MGNVYTSAELKPIRIDVLVVLGELWFGHITRFYLEGWCYGVSCFGRCSTVVSCAMTDDESGSN